MDFVIPVALGELLAEMYILTAAELNRNRAKALAWPKLRALGLLADISKYSNRCFFSGQRYSILEALMKLQAGEAGGVLWWWPVVGWRE